MILPCEMCILLLFIIAFTHWIMFKPRFPFGIIQLFVILWTCYMFIHALFIAEAELYRFSYLAITLSLLILFPYLLKTHLLSVKIIENGIFVILIIQILFLSLQLLGIIKSSSSFFSLTGTNDNPNITAMLIAASIPVLLKRMRESTKVYYYLFLVIVSAIYLILLKCRTAYIGLAVTAIVLFLTSEMVRNKIKGLSISTKIFCGVITLLMFTVFSIYLYGSKQASSDGRLLIWKLSSRMITEHPEGIGIGKFGRDYNLRQAQYFMEETATEEERSLASCNYMAYNDYLEMGVESGVIGMLLLFGFYLLLIYRCYRQKEYLSMSVVVAFMIMSSVNFIYTSMQPWLVLLCYATIGIRNDDQSKIKHTHNLLPIKCICLVACLLVLYRQVNIIRAQLELKRYQSAYDNNEYINIEDVKSLSSIISTSEAYWKFMYDLNSRKGDYEEGYKCLKKASCYVSDLKVYFSLYFCCKSLSENSQCLEYLKQIRGMVPTNLYCRYLMLKHYYEHAMKEQTISMANEILTIPVKVKNEQSDKIRIYAENILLAMDTSKQIQYSPIQ